MSNYDYRKRVELEDRIKFLLNENKKLQNELLILKSSVKCGCDKNKAKK